MVFQSLADDLVTGDSNGERDIFVTDLTKTQGAISLVSLAHDGSAANGESRWPSSSPDPDRPFIAFASEASNIDPLDGNAQRDVFVAEWKDPDA